MTERRLRTLEQLDPAVLRGRRVFLRVDFNVPLENGRVADTARLEAAIPTIRELTGAGAMVVLGSHCGRPKGKPDPAFSLEPVAASLSELLGTAVGFASDCIGEPAQAATEAMTPGDVCLLENLRYYAAEVENDPEFARALASLADTYVSDAFGVAHRAHASVVGVPSLLDQRAAGHLVVSEVEALGRLLSAPTAPFVIVLGGAKIAGKMDALRNLLPKIDILAVGGGMANTFLAAQGHDMGDSLVETERLEMAWDVLDEAMQNDIEILLPEDVIVTDSLEAPERTESVPADAIPEGLMAVDIGVDTRTRIQGVLRTANTVFWNGPMGVFERPPFDAGTIDVALAVAASPGYSVIGGGETVAAARRADATGEIDHISTGGGASIEFLAGRDLPGIVVLEEDR